MRDMTQKQTSETCDILRDVAFGRTQWSQLYSRGHHFQTVRSCVRRGFLDEPKVKQYALSDAGRTFLAER